MTPKCIAQVNAAAGRKLTDAQLADIESRLRRTQTLLAREDINAWRAMSADQRLTMAAERAMADVTAEAERKVRNAALQVLKTAATEERIGRRMRAGGLNRHAALVDDLNEARVYGEAIKRETLAAMLDTIDAARTGDGIGRRAAMALFDVENPTMTRDLAVEIFANADGGTGNAVARKGARAYLDSMEALRKRANATGADIGGLGYGYLPQPTDSVKVLRATADGYARAVLPLLYRSRYLNADGSRMDDAALLDFLRAAWDTLSTDGLNKSEPGQFRALASTASRGGQHREIHFKDGDAYLQYLSEYGGGAGMYDAIIGHVGVMARQVGLMERYGPNASAQMRLQADLAERADGGQRRVFAMRLESYWDQLSGTASTPAGRGHLAQIGQELRAAQVASKLGSALLSSFTDLGTFMVTVGYNRLSYFEAIKNIGNANRAEARQFLNAHGLMAESLIGDLNRWSGDHLRSGVMSRMANATMRLSLLNVWTDGLRRAFSLTMMGGLGRLKSTPWASLAEFDRVHLESKGITESDWQAIQRAELDEVSGQQMLTPQAVKAAGSPEAATKVLALILDEAETAVLNPDLIARTFATAGGMQAGTVRGELARALMQFKTFPITMMTRHWRRAFGSSMGTDGAPMMANRLAYVSALGLSLTALGALSFQSRQVSQGKDPVDMTIPKFWARAAAQGGALGFFGDVLLENSSDSLSRSDPLFRLAGPTAGTLADAFELTKGNLDEALSGKPTRAAAETVQFAKSHMPLINVWYARTALERAFLNDVQESLSPGYLSRVKQRAQRDWAQQFYWAPGDDVPARAPDLSAATGR